ncbi:alpha/beta hydrolase [Tundrisphaera sp. TA3]|uniref:alpha/beta hydrolase n=1 Tax=Tundrisphaera sp. TA3 TaxID=3435775 RepID=UPI003EBBF3E3
MDHPPDPAPAPAAPPRRKARWRRPAALLLRVAVVAYLGVAAVLFAFQERMIFPGAETRGRADAIVEPRPGTELVTLTTARGDRVVALFGPALTDDGRPRDDAATRPTILFFYGNAMCLAAATDLFEDFRRLGANVLIPDYVGYGMSSGKPGEIGCREAADAAFAHLAARPDVDRARIIAAGWSLGGAVALDLAARHRVAGVATFSAFTRMADMARRMFPILPASLLLRHRFDNLARIAEVGCPVLIGHGRRDQIIPYEMSDRLAAAARTPVARIAVDAADHNDFFWVGGDAVLDALRRFAESPAGSPQAAPRS